MNLYYYNARYYDAALGRFIQADSIVPYPISSKSYDRYAYVSNNPIIYIDPSGHCLTDSGAWIPDGLGGSCIFKTSNQVKNTTQQLESLGITVEGNDKQKQDVLEAAIYEMNKLRLMADNNPSFQSAHGEINIIFGATTDIDGKGFNGNCIFNHGTLSCKNDLTMSNAIHEFAHAFDFTNFNSMGKKPSDYVPDAFLDREDIGYLCTNIECIAHPSTMDIGWRYDDELKGIRRMEDFANMYQNWILSGDLNYPQSGFDSSTDEGVYRYSFMSARGNNWYPDGGVRNWLHWQDFKWKKINE